MNDISVGLFVVGKKSLQGRRDLETHLNSLASSQLSKLPGAFPSPPSFTTNPQSLGLNSGVPGWTDGISLEILKYRRLGKREKSEILCFLKPKGNDMLSEVRELSHGVEELAESVWVAKVDVRVEERVDNILQSERRRGGNLEQGNGKRRSSPSSFDRLGRA